MRKPRVLVVEDDLDLRNLHDFTLSEAGFEVVLDADGHQALNIVQRSKPDVILTDLMMPGMDGIELIENIRAIERLKDIPIFVLSAGGKTLLGKALAAGANKIIGKPIDPLILWTNVWEMVPMDDKKTA